MNRTEAIPIISITGPEDYVPTPEGGGRSPGKRDVLRQALPTGKLKEKLESLSGQAEGPESPNTMPGRLFTMYRYHLRSKHGANFNTQAPPAGLILTRYPGGLLY